MSGGIRGGRSDFELSDEILSVIPNDPFEQLDLARKITSMAIASRVSNLEAELIDLKQILQEKEISMHELERKTYYLERDLREADSRLKIVLHDNMNLKKERDSLAVTVKNLSHDKAKLETFKRQLIQSLSNEKTEPVDIKTYDHSVPSSYPHNAKERENVHSFHHSYGKSADATLDEALKYTGPKFSITPYISSPWITPTRTPKIISPRSSSASESSPKRTSGAMSPSSTHFESRKTNFWYLSSQQSSAANSPPRGLPLPARSTRVDGKEFFRQVRNRLSYEKFKEFLANIKELNAQKQTREETLRKADEIFGTENKDLYMSFQGLVTRNKS